MQKTYYLFNPGRLSRKDNTLKFTPVDEEGQEGQPKYLPIEGVSELYCFGALDANSALYNFLGQQGVAIHFFDYYQHYTGSFMPRDYLQAGQVHVAQVRHYLSVAKRTALARGFLEGASANMLRNLKYYEGRGKAGVRPSIQGIEGLVPGLAEADSPASIMGVEGNIREQYYQAFDHILEGWQMGGRSRQPPANEVNALISFGNMMCYSLCLSQLYHTQLDPTISFLHEPGARRFSLSLDLAEVFKPLLTDRVIFRVLNKREIQKSDFVQELNGCTLKESGRKAFVRAWEEKLNETIRHRGLGRHVSYRRLVRLEAYKLVKHVMGVEEYRPFKAWW